MPHFGGQVYADVPLFALSTVALLVTTLVIRDGPTDRRLLALAAVCVALALTKAPGLVIAVLCAVAVVTVTLARRVNRHASTSPSLTTFVPLAMVSGVLAIGPYLVNLARYGELSGRRSRRGHLSPTAGPQADGLVVAVFRRGPARCDRRGDGGAQRRVGRAAGI